MAKHKKQKTSVRSLQRKPQINPQGTKPASKPAQPPTSKKPIEPTIPFTPYDSILLIGDGDLSFAKSIVEHQGCCDVTATTFDIQSKLYEKYQPQAEQHVRYLEDEGQKVLYGVDATKLNKDKQIKKLNTQWNVIIFNFPHVGGKSTDVNRQVRFNQELLVSFFAAAMPLLSRQDDGGTIVVTLFEGEPYTLWNVRDLARHCGLEVVRSFRFRAEAYSGYSHARTLGNIEGGGGWKGEDREARSYVFRSKAGFGGGAGGGGREEAVPARAVAKRKREEKERERDDSSDDDDDDDED